MIMCKREASTGYSLVGFDQLIESQQAAIPAAAVLSLQVHADLIHNGSPAAGKVVFNDGSKTHGQLGATDSTKPYLSSLTASARLHCSLWLL